MAAMYDKILINGIDVTSYRLKWEFESEWKYAIDSLTIEFSPSINNLMILNSGMSIVVSRGFITDSDEIVFSGDLTQVKPQVDRMVCVCKSRLNDAIKYGRTKSWDKDIDPQGGVGSEIFKDICDHCQLDYDSTSIPSTGTDPADLIVKFIQNDQDDFQMMDSLSETYGRIITYDYANSKVNWQPEGFSIYSASLTVGTDIQNQIKWKENMEQLNNLVKVNGATVYDKINPAVFAGPATEFQLLRTPEDTEVRDTSATGTLYTRGQKGIGIIGTDYDYYVDTEAKKIIFGSAKSNVWVRYGAQVPMPVLLRNQTSIDTYGGPNKIPHFKAFTFNDIKDVQDAEDRARTILEKYSTPFIETNDLQINDPTIIANGLIGPGYLINIIDSFNPKYPNVNVFVKIVKKSYPHVGDRVVVGDQIWREEDWKTETMKKINLLFQDLNKNQDILISGFDFSSTIKFKNRYFYAQKRDISGDIGIYGNTAYGIYGTSKYGDGSTYPWTTISLLQGKNIYREFVKDSVFYDSVNSVGITWNTTTNVITFANNGVLITNALTIGTNWTSILLAFASTTGSFAKYEISQDSKGTWEEIDYNTVYNIVSTSTGSFYLRITAGAAGATIENTYDSLSSGGFLNPAISLTFS
jgi:hypothetical protein